MEVGQVWQHIVTGQQIRLKDINNKVILAEMVNDGRPVFLTVISLESEYKPADQQIKQAINGKK